MTSSRQTGSLESLTRAYGWLLWAFPKWWRIVYGDEVKGVLVQLAHDRGHALPEVREAASLLGNGLLMRVEGVFALCSLRTRQRAAMLAAVLAGVLSLVALVVAEFIPWRAGVPLAGPVPDFMWAETTLLGPMSFTAGLGALPAVGSVLGLVLALLRRARAAQGVFAVTAACIALLPLLAVLTGIHRPPLFRLGPVFALSLVAAAAPARLAPGHRRVIAWGLGVVGISVGAMAWNPQGLLGWVQLFSYLPLDGLHPMSQAGVVVSLTAVLIFLVAPQLRGWVMPLILVAVPWWVQAAYLADAFPPVAMMMSPHGFLLTCAAATTAIAATGAVAHVAGKHTFTLDRSSTDRHR